LSETADPSATLGMTKFRAVTFIRSREMEGPAVFCHPI
jgi:hypothetical protein